MDIITRFSPNNINYYSYKYKIDLVVKNFCELLLAKHDPRIDGLKKIYISYDDLDSKILASSLSVEEILAILKQHFDQSGFDIEIKTFRGVGNTKTEFIFTYGYCVK